MARERATVLEQQGIWDMAIQCHGTVESVFNVLADNAMTTGLNTALTPGQVLLVTSAAGDVDVKAYYKANDLHPITGPYISTDGDFNNDFSTDFYITDDN